MSRLLPYPGHHESFSSWDYRCKQWERNRYSNQSKGLSGKPDKQGIDNDSYLKDLNGKKVEVVKTGYGCPASKRVERFASYYGYDFARYNGNGHSGMCERVDGIAYKGKKYFNRFEVYDNDDH